MCRQTIRIEFPDGTTWLIEKVDGTVFKGVCITRNCVGIATAPENFSEEEQKELLGPAFRKLMEDIAVIIRGMIKK